MVKDLPILAGLVALGAVAAVVKPLDGDLVAKVGYFVGMANSAYVVLAPAKGAALYGLPSTPLMLLFLESMAMVTLSSHAMAYCLLDRGTSINTALGVCGMITAVIKLKSLINDDIKNTKLKPGPHIVIFVLSAALAHASFTDASYGDIVKYLFIFRGFFHGVTLTLFPEKISKAYGVATDVKILYAAKLLGTFGLANGIFCLGLVVLEMESLTAYAWSWVPELVSGVLGHFILGDTEKTGTKLNPKLAWMALQVVVVCTILLDFGSGSEGGEEL